MLTSQGSGGEGALESGPWGPGAWWAHGRGRAAEEAAWEQLHWPQAAGTPVPAPPHLGPGGVNRAEGVRFEFQSRCVLPAATGARAVEGVGADSAGAGQGDPRFGGKMTSRF